MPVAVDLADPPHVAVVAVGSRRVLDVCRGRCCDPFGGYDLLAFPLAFHEDSWPILAMSVGLNLSSAAPMFRPCASTAKPAPRRVGRVVAGECLGLERVFELDAEGVEKVLACVVDQVCAGGLLEDGGEQVRGCVGVLEPHSRGPDRGAEDLPDRVGRETPRRRSRPL